METYAYECRECSGIIWTRMVDEGTTPFVLKCRSRFVEGCDGMMISLWGQTPDFWLEDAHVHWEWFKPTELASLAPAMREHVEMEGLDLRRIPCDKPPEMQGPDCPFWGEDIEDLFPSGDIMQSYPSAEQIQHAISWQQDLP